MGGVSKDAKTVDTLLSLAFKKFSKNLADMERGIQSTSRVLNRFEIALIRAEKLMQKLGKSSRGLVNKKMLAGMYAAGETGQHLGKKDAAGSKLFGNLQKQKSIKMKYIGSKQPTKNTTEKSEANSSMKNAAFSGASLLLQSAQQAAAFETAMLGVREAVSFETPEQFKAMEQDILRMSNSLPLAASELASVVAVGGKSGIVRDELSGFAQASVKMGMAFGISAQQAGSMMGKWRGAFSMNQEQANALADKINYLGNTTTASESQIAAIVSSVGTLGSAGAKASGEIAALGASMSEVSVAPEDAATGIKSMVQALNIGAQASQKQVTAFTQLGLNSSELAQRMQTDAKGSIMQVLGAVQSLDQGAQQTVVQDLFGSEAATAILPLLSNLQLLQGNLDKVAEGSQYAGSVQEDFAARMNSAEGKVQLAKNSLGNFATAMGTTLLPAIGWLADRFVFALGKLTAFSSEFPVLSGLATGLVAALVAGSAAIFGIQSAISMLMLPFQTLMSLYRGYKTLMLSSNATKITSTVLTYGQAAATLVCTTAQWAWNTAMIAFNASAGLIMVSMLALVACGFWLYENWGIIKAWFVTLWNDPKLALDQFIDGMMKRFNDCIDFISNKWDGFVKIFKSPVNAQVNAGQNSEQNSADIKAYAYGGRIAGKTLAWFAERGPEYAIPMDGSIRSVGLWKQAGRELGVASGGSTGVSLQYSPTIQVSGNADIGQLQTVLDKQKNEFERMLRDFISQRERVSYG